VASRIFGHRGASADFPENTLEAFIGALEQGADGIELDVMLCSSGELVVCHDEWLNRLAGRHLEVARTPWQTLRALDVGSTLGFRPARMPLLEEVFDALPHGTEVNVELKCLTVDDRGLSEAVGRLMRDRALAERVVMSSFNPLCLVRLAVGYPELRRGLLIDPDRAFIPQDWFWLPVTAQYSVHPHFSACTSRRIREWKSTGRKIAVWTVDDEREARRLTDLGADVLITNRPGALRRELELNAAAPAGGQSTT
jgi:glycerophosphoryl diester phosphodiesterase